MLGVLLKGSVRTNFNGTRGIGAEIFPRKIPAAGRPIQLFDDSSAFLDCLEGFVNGGLQRGEGVIVIAGGWHLRKLEQRLRTSQVSLAFAKMRDQYLTLGTEDVLAKFISGRCLDEQRFRQFASLLVERARGEDGRHVRAFFEMPGWPGADSGELAAHLNRLWTEFSERMGNVSFVQGRAKMVRRQFGQRGIGSVNYSRFPLGFNN